MPPRPAGRDKDRPVVLKLHRHVCPASTAQKRALLPFDYKSFPPPALHSILSRQAWGTEQRDYICLTRLCTLQFDFDCYLSLKPKATFRNGIVLSFAPILSTLR